MVDPILALKVRDVLGSVYDFLALMMKTKVRASTPSRLRRNVAALLAARALAWRDPINFAKVAFWYVTNRKLRARSIFWQLAASLPNAYLLWRLRSPTETGSWLDIVRSRAPASAQESRDFASSGVAAGPAGEVTFDLISKYSDFRHAFVDSGCDFMLFGVDAENLDRVVRAVRDADYGDNASVLIFDEDERDQAGRRINPWLKPEWDQDLFLAQDYVSRVCAISVPAARALQLDEFPPEIASYAVIANLMVDPKRTCRAARVPVIAASFTEGIWAQSFEQRSVFVRDYLARRIAAEIVEAPFGTLQIRRLLPATLPKVSVVVPTRDRLDLLSACVHGVLDNTDYPDVELLIVDNGSVNNETHRFFDSLAMDARVRIIRWPLPYNYAAINNAAVTQAGGDILCFLNNDTEIVNSGWLRAMVQQALRPEVGAVGAKLLYPDGTLQHAGVVVGLGGAAGHAHRGLPNESAGYFAQPHIARGATAVTAACLVVAKEKFLQVGGFDSTNLGIAYNDVDLCLSLISAGYMNFYEPAATLIHHESKSRGSDLAPENLDRYIRELNFFKGKWNTAEYADRTFHPWLDPSSEQYRIRIWS